MGSPYDLLGRDNGSAEIGFTGHTLAISRVLKPGGQRWAASFLSFHHFIFAAAKSNVHWAPVQTRLHLHACESSNCVEQQHRLCCIDVALSSNDQYAPIHKKDWRMQRITTAHPEPFTHKHTLTPACASLSHVSPHYWRWSKPKGARRCCLGGIKSESAAMR